VSESGSNLFWVNAPRDGSIVEADVYQDQQVTPDRESPLMRISDLREVIVFASVQEREAAELAPGQAVLVTSAGREPRAALIEYVSDVVDPQRRTVEVRVRAHNGPRPAAFDAPAGQAPSMSPIADLRGSVGAPQ
jgi:cobalt-zinc-cadmium efflux system membrane fusion protein